MKESLFYCFNEESIPRRFYVAETKLSKLFNKSRKNMGEFAGLADQIILTDFQDTLTATVGVPLSR